MKLRNTLIVILIIGFGLLAIFNLKNIPEYFFWSDEEFFNNAVSTSFDESYHGVVIEKYHDQGRNIILIKNDNGLKSLDYVYQKKAIYKWVSIGDSIIKKTETNTIRIKNSRFDTLILLKFDNLKGYEIYSKKTNCLSHLDPWQVTAIARL
jgi:hypothetical protein